MSDLANLNPDPARLEVGDGGNNLAMPAQNLQLVGNLWRRLQVAGIGVAGDQEQCLLLAAASNEDRWMGPCEALRQVERALNVVVLPLERSLVSLFALPHVQANL